jgi:hypothetical protein
MGSRFEAMSWLQLCIFFRYSLNTINIVIAIENPSLMNKTTAALSLINLWDTLLWERCGHDMVLVWGTLLGILDDENLSRWSLLRISILYFLWKPSWFIFTNLSSLSLLEALTESDLLLIGLTIVMNCVLMFFDMKCMAEEYSSLQLTQQKTAALAHGKVDDKDLLDSSSKTMISESVRGGIQKL